MKLLLKIPLALILVFFVAVLLTVYIITQTTLLHRTANELLTQYIETKYEIDIDFGGIDGSFLKGFSIHDIRVNFEVKPTNYRLVKIEKMDIYYNLRKLIKGNWQLDSLDILNPIFVLRNNTEGKLLFPDFSGSGGEERTPINLKIGKFRISNGRFQWFRNPQILFIDNFHLTASAELNNGVATVSIDSLSFIYPQKNFKIEQLRCDFAIRNNALGIDSIYLKTAQSELRGGALLPLNSEAICSFKLVDSHVSFDEISKLVGSSITGEVYLNLEGGGFYDAIEGNADLEGTLFDRYLGPLTTNISYSDGLLKFDGIEGEAFDGTVKGNIKIDLLTRPEVFAGDLKVKNLNLNKIVPNTFISSLNGDLQVRGSGLGENSFNLDLAVALNEGKFDFVRYDSINGVISLNVNDLYFHPNFQMNYENSHFSTEGMVNYKGEINLHGEFVTDQLADFWGDLFLEELSGKARSSYHVYGNNQDPNIEGEFFGDSCSFYGFSTDSLIAKYSIESFLYSQKGSVDIFSWQSDVWNIPADSVSARIMIDSQNVIIDSASLFAERYLFDIKAQALLHDSTAEVAMNDFLFRFDSLEYKNVATVNISFLTDRIIVDTLHIRGEGGEAYIHSNYGYDSTLFLTAKIDTFPFAPWLKAFDADTTLTGLLDCYIETSGKLSNPLISLTGGATNLKYNNTAVGSIDGELLLADSVIQVERFELSNPGGVWSVAGFFPLIVDLDSGKLFVPEKGMSLTLESQGDDLSLVSLALEELESFTGDYQLQLELSGTPYQPQSNGNLTLHNGVAKIYYLENPIEQLEVTAKSEGKLVEVEANAVISYEGKSGEIGASGYIFILNKDQFDYDIFVAGNDVPIKYDLGDIYARCDLELDLQGYEPPLVTGNVTVYECLYEDEFYSEDLLAAIDAADTSETWDYSIDVELLPASVNVKNSEINAVVDGELRVIREGARDNYIGTLNIVRGNYYLFDIKFKIQDGSQILFDNIELPDPKLSILANTDVRNYSSGGEPSLSGYDHLELMITGTLLQPYISSAEGSVYSDEDIAAILATRTSGDIASAPLGSRMELAGYGAVSNLLSRTFTRKLGIETLDISPGYNEADILRGTTILLGFRTTENLYTYFASPVSLESGTELGFEYRIGRHFFLAGRRDRDKLFHLNLNYNLEFK